MCDSHFWLYSLFTKAAKIGNYMYMYIDKTKDTFSQKTDLPIDKQSEEQKEMIKEGIIQIILSVSQTNM